MALARGTHPQADCWLGDFVNMISNTSGPCVNSSIQRPCSRAKNYGDFRRLGTPSHNPVDHAADRGTCILRLTALILSPCVVEPEITDGVSLASHGMSNHEQ
jgi:hypothetical protein